MISGSPNQEDKSFLSPIYSSSGECAEPMSITAMNLDAWNKLGSADKKYLCGSMTKFEYSGSSSLGISFRINGGRIGTYPP